VGGLDGGLVIDGEGELQGVYRWLTGEHDRRPVVGVTKR